ncbi:MAG: T9SS type A sorting domain-containing protein [Candidatus Aegiribacteria sp.]|nr:T9SS type A sorting domain-containing protein [Candidatus Aegiribacteria sp.]MBD3294424.1 T9SS type A sorting domain-containing protein [Candidatus Fermentibacteria bacterium]
MQDFPGLGSPYYDTAWISGGLWIARDNADSPILCYDTGGVLTGHVDGATVSAAMGLTIDGEGYLWASNPDDDKIYQIDVSTGVEEGTTGALLEEIRVEHNPFSSSAVITGSGFEGATIEIFDVSGRTMESGDFSGSFTWNAADAPSGTYFAVVRGGGAVDVVRMTKIR